MPIRGFFSATIWRIFPSYSLHISTFSMIFFFNDIKRVQYMNTYLAKANIKKNLFSWRTMLKSVEAVLLKLCLVEEISLFCLKWFQMCCNFNIFTLNCWIWKSFPTWKGILQVPGANKQYTVYTYIYIKISRFGHFVFLPHKSFD